MEKEIKAIDQILDENNYDNVILYNENGEEVEFKQVAIIPLNNEVYVILKPVVLFEGMDEDEGLVFLIEDNGEEPYFRLCLEDEIIDEVFRIYYSLLQNKEN